MRKQATESVSDSSISDSQMSAESRGQKGKRRRESARNESIIIESDSGEVSSSPDLDKTSNKMQNLEVNSQKQINKSSKEILNK